MSTYEHIKAREFTLDGGRYRTDTSWLLAADEKKEIFLYRAHNSIYFVHKEGVNDSFESLSIDDALSLYHELPMKFESSRVNAFPSYYGGIGLDTHTRYDYENEEA